MNSPKNDCYLAASMYYLQGETMDTIARQMGTSRSTVSRLLKQARETGVVHITVTNPSSPQSNVAKRLEKAFGIKVYLVTLKSGASDHYRLRQVARTAGQIASQMIQDNMIVGVSWGTTVDAIAQHLIPKDVNGVRVVQMNGAANAETSGIPYVGTIISRFAEAFGAAVTHFPVPCFFDYPANRETMWRERSVRNAIEMQRRIDLAIFGVGSPSGPLPSHVYRAGYVDDKDLAQLSLDRVIGDISTVFIREDGSWRDVPMNTRASGMNPSELLKLPRRLCTVAGVWKSRALLGALRTGVVTDLVVDDQTARAVVELMEG